MSEAGSVGNVASPPVPMDTVSIRLRGALHPIVKLDYVVRIPAAILIGAILVSVMLEKQTSVYQWWGIAIYALLWPHIAYLHAKLSRDSKFAEHLNLLIEASLLGFYATMIEFQLWPLVAFIVASNSANLSIGGKQLAIRGVICWLISALLTGAVAGFRLDHASAPMTIALSILTIFVYTGLFALNSHNQTRHVLKTRQELLEQNRRIEEQRAEIERAKVHADEQRAAAEEARHAAEEARQTAVSANEAKSSFLANMSHELRTPLNAIIGYSEMLLEDAQDGGHEDIISDLEKIRTSGKHLLGLINSVLDLSKIEAGKMGLFIETFMIPALIDEVVVTARPLVEAKGNRFIVNKDPFLGDLKGDVTKLKQILLNLLSNASKFTEKGTVRLDVEYETAEDSSTWVTFKVTDSGIGMNEQQLGKLFQAFTQADASTTRKYGGTGLGLVISRRFCQQMGGDITVTSVPGQGTTFTVKLPADVSNAEGEASRIYAIPAEFLKPKM